MTKKLYTIQAKVNTFRWYWENFLANINKDKPTDKKLFIHIPKNAGMTIRRSDLLKDKIIDHLFTKTLSTRTNFWRL